jgi:hypothetical protein
MFVARMEAKLESLAQSCLRLLNAAFHYREYRNSANPESATVAPQRQPPQIGCLAGVPSGPGGPEGTRKAVRRKIAACHRHIQVGPSPRPSFTPSPRPHPSWSDDPSAPGSAPFGQDWPPPNKSSPSPSAIPSRDFSQLPPKPQSS